MAPKAQEKACPMGHPRPWSAKSTGAREGDIGTAESALANYLARKNRPDFGDGHPARVLIADVLADYGETHGPTTSCPEIIGAAITKLLEYFGDQTVAAVTSATCKKYVQWRVLQFNARAKVNARPIKPSTARRELVVLGAALRWCWREAKLDRLVPVTLPTEASPRQRHLSRTEGRVACGRFRLGSARQTPSRQDQSSLSAVHTYWALHWDKTQRHSAAPMGTEYGGRSDPPSIGSDVSTGVWHCRDE